MPVFLFEDKKVTIVFKSAFEADMHEGKFNPNIWRRVHRGDDDDKSRRGNAFSAESLDPLALYYAIARFF